MLRCIRRWVYRFGFRPSPGSILYSPSRAMLEASSEALKYLERSVKEWKPPS